jgi:hypothetical protein
MKNIWYAINIALVALALAGGYNSLSAEKLRNKNPDAIFCGLILLVTPLFALWIVDHSIRRWNHSRLARPSLSRNPLNWWHDPLQSLFISTCVMASTAIGGALRRPTVGSVGFWMIAMYSCVAVGLVTGQVLVYRLYRKQIIAG